jgi:serine/threonine protein kinase
MGLDHPEDYGREAAPEVFLSAPYDPFKADVYQLGTVFLCEFHVSFFPKPMKDLANP